MPGTLMERMPLPTLRLYTMGSAVALGAAVYHAAGATGAPGWRGPPRAPPPEDRMLPLPAPHTNATRPFADHIADVATYMMQEPLCMWTLVNMAYCVVACVGAAVRRAVFGPLRVVEAQRLKDRFWNYVFYKFIFVFGVVNVQYMDEVVLWCAWFTLVGFLHQLAYLCKDRFEYIASLPREEGGAGAECGGRVVGAVWGVAVVGGALLPLAAQAALPHAPDTFAFMAAECVLVTCRALHVCARHVLQRRHVDAAGPLAYYTHLAFDSVCLCVEAGHVGHMVVVSRAVVSLPALVLLLQLRHLLHQLHHRLRRHRLYTALAHHITTNYPMASREEVVKHCDKCAICWEPMRDARKLPCNHLFHNGCLWQWVQQDASCPTCRLALAPPSPAPRAPHTNHLFSFDGSRYVAWLPSLSVEVSRGAHPARMVAQVQTLFPQYSRAALLADLAVTRSPDLTVDNILEGRLRAPDPPAPHSAPPPDFQHRWTSTTQEETTFGSEAGERESLLQQRKRALLEAARRRYLQRAHHLPTTSPS